MKFSVLLPTRNRLELLRYAVESVRRQDEDEWEIVISDNHSDEDIGSYVASFADPRMIYHRMKSFVPVTDNWNNALDHSSGDYIVMLGDDDCLMPGYFRKLRAAIEQIGTPDFIYTGAYLFAYPGVIPTLPKGFLQPYSYATFFRADRPEPFLLPRAEALALVKAATNFKVRYGFNMQFAAIGRSFIDSLRSRGPFFQSPFPDYYAMNVMFLLAKRILICPEPLVTIGVSPKSYGYYHNNSREAAGIEFLNSIPDPTLVKRLDEVILPGTNINTSWLLAVETIRERYGGGITPTVNYRRYRFLQMVHMFQGLYFDRTIVADELSMFCQRLTWTERVTSGWALSLFFNSLRLFPRNLAGRIVGKFVSLLGQSPSWVPDIRVEGYQNILEVFASSSPLRR